MTLPMNIGDREHKKFVEDTAGDVSVRTTASNAPYLETSNSTSTPLGAAGTYNAGNDDGWVDVAKFTSVVVACKADQDGTLYMEFSDTNSGTGRSTLTYDVKANLNEVHKLTVTRQYYRTRYLNGSVAQSSFEITTLIGNHSTLTAPLNLSLSQDADSIAVRSIDSETDIAEGKRTGYKIVNKFGKNPDIDTGTVPEDVWAGGGVYTGFPLADDELVTVVSTSANDTSAGSGARTVRIYGLDSDGVEQNEVITLNGTTAVDSVNTYTRVNRLTVLTSGSSNQAFNAGVLSVAHKTTTANVFVTVPVGTNQSQVGAYTIPANKTGYLRNIEVFMNRSNSATVDGAVWIRENGASPRLIRIFSISQNENFNDLIFGGIPLPGLTDMAIRISSSSANNVEVITNFDVLLVDD